jgi:hypothetical protein
MRFFKGARNIQRGLNSPGKAGPSTKKLTSALQL